ncbi:RNA ligase 1 isoform X3 [Sminthopsis crassicaudata]|uniref:RNA ligase 1 isoform X3 n=1 Tax=Sminthopsis crassicaudata TaxID=9301 RepID=UPI003D69EF7B
MRRLGSVQSKVPCVFVTEVKDEPSVKREHQPFKVLATETINYKALDADIYNAIPTEKVDGTCCYVTNYKGQPYLWARLDRKPNKQAEKRFKRFLYSKENSKENSKEFIWNVEEDFKSIPEYWIPAKDIEQLNGNPVPDENGHIPGLGSKKHPIHFLVPHGAFQIKNQPTLKHEDLLSWFEGCREGKIEGIVWHCNDGCLIKVHRHHLGLRWPIPETYMNSQPVVINMNRTKFDCAFDSKCLFNHFSKLDNQKFSRLKDIKLDVGI